MKTNQTKLSKQQLVQKCSLQKYHQKYQILNLQCSSNGIIREYYFSQQLYVGWYDVIGLRDWVLIKILNLKGCLINDQNIQILLKNQWPNLQDLYLSNHFDMEAQNKISDTGIQLFIDKKWPKLKQLFLSFNYIGNHGLKLLSENILQNLVQFRIGSNQLKIQKLCKIHEEFNFDHLMKLTLDKNKIGCYGVKLLVKVPLKSLQTLWLYEAEIGSEGCKYLIKGHWPNLQNILINQNKITLDGNLSLSQANWNKLKQINYGQEIKQIGNGLKFIDGVSLPHLFLTQFGRLIFQVKLKTKDFSYQIMQHMKQKLI